jgi:hypothetical protein
MFDIIDSDLFTDRVHEIFGVLDRRYVEDLSKELLGSLRATFDGAFETRFIILERETGKPLNVNAVLNTHDAAEQFLRIVGEDKYMIGFLLLEQ